MSTHYYYYYRRVVIVIFQVTRKNTKFFIHKKDHEHECRFCTAKTSMMTVSLVSVRSPWPDCPLNVVVPDNSEERWNFVK